MLDEPSLGLSPKLIDTVFDKIVEINEGNAVAILIAEQKVREGKGKNVFEGGPGELKGDKGKLKELFL
jgi:ABC-type branched-subunit amino acid transport system ATPase component